MPAFDQYETFANLVSQPFETLYDITKGNVLNLNETLRSASENLIGEIRKNLTFYQDQPDKVGYLFDVKYKLTQLSESLFVQRNKKIYFQAAILVEPDAGIDSDIAFAIYGKIRELIQHIEKREALYSLSSVTKNQQSPVLPIPRPEKSPKSYKSNTFILNARIDKNDLIEGIQELCKEGFLFEEETTIDDFLHCLSGGPVLKKVPWNRTIALVYFIQRMATKKIIVADGGGILICAANCFLGKNNKELTPSILDRTKTDAFSKADIIDRIIDHIEGKKHGKKTR